MKKFLFALFAGLMIFAFSACGSSDSDNTKTTTATDSDLASDSNLSEEDGDTQRYTSDGELIVEEERPASDTDLSEEEN